MTQTPSASIGHASGVVAHSGPAAFEDYTIFAVGDDTRSADFKAWAAINGYAVKAVMGCYKGEQEIAFVIRTADIDTTLRYWLAGQESVLELGSLWDKDAGRRRGARPAQLRFLSPKGYDTLRVEPLGRLYDYGTDRPKTDAWTYDPDSNTYFACR